MLTNILRITAHPLCRQNDRIKKSYIKGLGAVLHKISNGHPNMKVLFEQWGTSILGHNVDGWFQSDDISYIGKALALYRDGIHFFRVKNQFYFDCFYMMELFDKSLINNLNDFLITSGCNVFTKSALKQTFTFFREGTGTVPKVGEALIQHRRANLDFSGKYENRVLVVATVSAGKSTLINAMTGHYFNRVKTGVCTSRISKIHNKQAFDGITVKRGKLFDYFQNIDSQTSDSSEEVGFHFESELGSRRICLLDTPGLNNSRDEEHFFITSDAIKSKNYDLIIFISNCQYNGTNDEHQLLNLLHGNDKPIIFVLNQLDRFKVGEDSISRMLNDYKKELKVIGFDPKYVLPLSAQYAYYLKAEPTLDEDEQQELARMHRIFSNEKYDLQQYSGQPSNTLLEKSGLVALEKTIATFLK